jgi:hypothetical protein
MNQLIKAELFKLRKRSMSVVLLLILIAISILFMTFKQQLEMKTAVILLQPL